MHTVVIHDIYECVDRAVHKIEATAAVNVHLYKSGNKILARSVENIEIASLGKNDLADLGDLAVDNRHVGIMKHLIRKNDLGVFDDKLFHLLM